MIKKDDFILKTLKYLSWLSFVLLCFVGVNVMVASVLRFISGQEENSNYSGLGPMHYLIRESFLIGGIVLTAFLFFQIIKIFRILDLAAPFSEEVGKFIFKISYISFGLSIFKMIAHMHEKYLVNQGFESGMINKYYESAITYLLMACILLLIAQIFKKGIELKNESDLTV